MGAAGYVGRVGGLAVALGIGTAVLTGAAVASADSGTEGSSPGGSSATSPAGTGATETNTAGTPASSRAERPRFQLKLPRLSGLVDRPPATTRTEQKPSNSAVESDDATPLTRVSATQVVKRKRPASIPDPGPTAGSASVAPTALTEAVSTVVGDVVAPSAKPVPKPLPSSPASAASSLLLGAARRELGADRLNYSPEVDVEDGVITGQNPNAAPGLTYTAVGTPSGGGKVYLDKATGKFSYLPYSDVQNADKTRQFDPESTFDVMVSENTPFVRALQELPVVGGLVEPIVLRIHQIPILGDVLSPIIGRAQVFTVTVYDQAEANQYGAPIAYTTTVVSFDQTPISVNWFPAYGLGFNGFAEAPTLLNGPSLATAGYIDPDQETTVFGLVPGLDQLRDGYNVVTWDPRGEYASGGVLQLDSPDFEARDVSAIITWVTQQKGTQFDPGAAYTPGADSTPDGLINNPLIGMVGGSYGGGIQLTSAGIDQRIDAIAPGIAWNNLVTTLYPNHGFKTSFASLLLLSLVASGSRINPTIYSGIITGAALGILTPGQKDFLETASPSNVVGAITAPTLLLQGTVDVLFPLQQALDNAAQIGTDPSVTTPPVRMVWYCGGHGQCLDPVDQDAQTAWLATQTMAWMDRYVKYKGQPVPGDVPLLPTFQWVDQKGTLYSSDLLPTAPGFQDSTPIVSSTGHGVLGIVPVLGGSGPERKATFPVSLATASPAANAIKVDVPNPTGSGVGQQSAAYVVGSPTLTMTYSGVGTTRNVYAQLVDKNTGRVVGNILTPIPVILDGKQRSTGPISMENIAYTMEPGDELELQIVGTATPFENFTSYGVIDVRDVQVSLPTADPGVVTKRDSFHTSEPQSAAGTLLGI